MREPLAPTGKPCVSPAATLATPIASTSCSARTCWPCLPGERPRGEDLVGEADEEDPDRRRQEQQGVTAARDREVEGREPAWDTPDHRDAALLEVEPPGDPDRGDDDEQRRGEATGDVRGARIRIASASAPTSSVRPLVSPSSRTTSASCGSGSRASMSRPSSLPELRDDEHDGDAVQVADQDRPREVVGEPAEAQRTRGEEASRRRGPRARPASSTASALPATASGKTAAADERRDRALRSDDELPRGTEQDVGDHREEQRVEAVDRRERRPARRMPSPKEEQARRPSRRRAHPAGRSYSGRWGAPARPARRGSAAGAAVSAETATRRRTPSRWVVCPRSSANESLVRRSAKLNHPVRMITQVE